MANNDFLQDLAKLMQENSLGELNHDSLKELAVIMKKNSLVNTQFLDELAKILDALQENSVFMNGQVKDSDEAITIPSDKVILGTFYPCPIPSCPNVLTPELIYRRLILIDSIYSTNAYRMGKFAIDNITQAIWECCKDAKGIYTDVELVKKADDYLNLILSGKSTSAHPIDTLINNSYGHFRNKSSWVNNEQSSLVTKYLHHLVEAYYTGNKKLLGFPIWDRVVRGILPSISDKLGLPKISKNPSFEDYVKNLNDLWLLLSPLTKGNSALSPFRNVDKLLWTIGKVKNAKGDWKQLALLMTQQEFITCVIKGTTAPKFILDIDNFIKRWGI